MHPVLRRQLTRSNLDPAHCPDQSTWLGFLTVVANTYSGHDQDRYLLERSLTLSSKEMGDLHEALRRDREQLVAVIDSLDRGLIVLNRDLRVEIVNPEAVRIIGAPAQELRTWSVRDLVRCAADDPTFAAIFDELIKQPFGWLPERTVCEDRRLRSVDGRTVAVSASVIPIQHDGVLHGVVLVLSDISEQQQLEMELRQSQKLEAVGRLAAGVAHEINTPMQFLGDNLVFIESSVAAVLRVLEQTQALLTGGVWTGEPFEPLIDAIDACDPEFLAVELPQALNQSRDGIERVTSIVRAMKSFAHPGNATAEFADINEALRDTITVARGELREVGDVILDLTDLPPVRCLIHDLKQVFLNLVINAAHAIADRAALRPGRGRIVVTSACVDDFVVITISDDGGGIPDEVAEHVFEPFFTTKEVGRGSGQGLALARRSIVDGHHGRLGFTTEVDVGTTFQIHLPVGGV